MQAMCGASDFVAIDISYSFTKEDIVKLTKEHIIIYYQSKWIAREARSRHTCEGY